MPADPLPRCGRAARFSERDAGAGEGADRDQAVKRDPTGPAFAAGPAPRAWRLAARPAYRGEGYG